MENTLAKIAISTASDEALSKSLERVNQNFDGGRVSKTDLASWFLIQGTKSLDDSSVEEIRQAHFNQVTYLETLVKKLKTTGRDSLAASEVATLQAMLSQQSTKKRGKTSTKQIESTVDDVTVKGSN
jgi:hypothetical protein